MSVAAALTGLLEAVAAVPGLEAVAAIALLALLAIILFELWLVQLALTIIARTPLLSAIVPVEVRYRDTTGFRRMLRRRRWWGGGERRETGGVGEVVKGLDGGS